MRTRKLTDLELEFIHTDNRFEEILTDVISNKELFQTVSAYIHEELTFEFGVTEEDNTSDVEVYRVDFETALAVIKMCGFKKVNTNFVTVNLKTNRKQRKLIKTSGILVDKVSRETLEKVWKRHGYKGDVNYGVAYELYRKGTFNATPSLNDYDGVQCKISVTRMYAYEGKKPSPSSGQSDIMVYDIIKEINGRIYRIVTDESQINKEFIEYSLKYHFDDEEGEFVVDYIPHNRQFKSNYKKHKHETVIYVPVD